MWVGPVIKTVGVGRIVILALAVAVHPFAALPVTE
jgi:hypothetical protein